MRLGTVTLLALLGIRLAAGAGENLLVNPSFEDPDAPFKGWRYVYDLPGESWYFNNHKDVAHVAKESGRKNVVKLHGIYATLQAPGQGIKIDSYPVPFEYGSKYKLSLSARTTGPNARIYIEGYKWKPGIKPHENPEYHELRRIYKQGAGSMLSFRGEGTFSNPQRNWKQASCTFPADELSSLAKKHLRPVRFLAVHIVAIGGSDGDLFIDDVALEKIK